MNPTEQKRLRGLASGLLVDLGRVPDTDENAALIESAILVAIEPYRAALASARNLLKKAPVRDGYLNWRTMRVENAVAIDALLGEP